MDEKIVALTGDIVSAQLGKRPVLASEVVDLIRAVYRTLVTLGDDKDDANPPMPAVAVNRSVQHSHIVCLEDGGRYSMLKRHLRKVHKMTPDEYRARWNLPSDYPMISPAYAKRRSEISKTVGLGRKRRS